MFISNNNLLIKSVILCILIKFIFFVHNIKASNAPYPYEPANTNNVNTETPILKWKGSTNFAYYKVEIFDCTYYEGSSFNSVELEDYTFTYYESDRIGYESSAFTNHERRGDYITIDDSGTEIVSYANDFNSIVGMPINNVSGSDYEGISYLYDDYFAIVEERLDQLTFFKFNYSNGGILQSINPIITHNLNNAFITGANNGYEGITYNPRSQKMYLIKEYNDKKIFELDAPQAPNFNQSINLTEPFNLEQVSWSPDDVAGLYHMSLNHAFSATPAGEHILLLSQESYTIYEIDLNGNLISQLPFDLSGILGSYTNGFFQPEGITYKDGVIWIACEGSNSDPAKYFGYKSFGYEPPYAATNSLVYSKNSINGTQLTVPACALDNGTEYCWKVTGYTANGLASESMYHSFFVQASSSACTSCPLNVIHTQGSTLINNLDYEASNLIQSNLDINNVAELNYYAGNEINLTNGFAIDEQCNFLASIQDCN